ncbi:MAG TPA: hypothetical protein VK901_06315 [Nitrospiraceae bacterium]|nr:hypothetical protein [Nitrospiraceae bacterium]
MPVLRRRTRAEFSLLSQLTEPFAPEGLTHTAPNLLDISTSLGKTGTTSSTSIKITRESCKTRIAADVILPRLI